VSQVSDRTTTVKEIKGQSHKVAWCWDKKCSISSELNGHINFKLDQSTEQVIKIIE